MGEFIWHRIEDGVPQKPDTPYKTYIVWWAHFDNGYGGVFDAASFCGETMQFKTPFSYWFDPSYHRITHWAEVPNPESSKHNPEKEMP